MSVVGRTVADYKALLTEWHPTRNLGLSPLTVKAGSNRRVWWKCAKGHEFLKSPNGRTNNQRARLGSSICPRCLAARNWSWDKVVITAQSIVEKQGHLPTAVFLRKQGHSRLVSNVYRSGKSWADLRVAVESFAGSSFVASRSRIRWRSHPEAAVSNFLFARGIYHEKGRRYPPEYEAYAKKTYGHFDMRFRDRAGRLIDVEIWGDKPNGADPTKYAEVRRLKETFLSGRTDFLGIHWTDCASDEALTRHFEPFVGVVDPHVFIERHDPYVETSHWTNADEVLDTCRRIAAQRPDGELPNEQWLRKRGRFKNRDGPGYSTLAGYITKWLGGIRKVRELLGQPQASTRKWDRVSVLAEMGAWLKRYGKSPAAVLAQSRRGKRQLDAGERALARNLGHAARKHIGSQFEVCRILGLAPSRKPARR